MEQLPKTGCCCYWACPSDSADHGGLDGPASTGHGHAQRTRSAIYLLRVSKYAEFVTFYTPYSGHLQSAWNL